MIQLVIKKISAIFLLLAVSWGASAVTCTGNVIYVMAHASQCDGELAYHMASSAADKWFCTFSSGGGSVVLTAFTAGKRVTTVLAGSTESCTNLSAHYLKPAYLYIRD